MEKKEYKWKIKILKTENKNIMVGVAPYDFDINTSLYKYGWYIYCNNRLVMEADTSTITGWGISPIPKWQATC